MILTAAVAATYPFVIQYKRGGLWRLLTPAVVVVLLLDILAHYTEWSFVFGKPAKGEYTITRRIRRMHSDPLPSRREFAKIVQTFMDACEPDGKH